MRFTWCAAFLASLTLHAGLAWVLARCDWTGPPRLANPSGTPASNVLYGRADGNTGDKLLPGDGRNGGAPGPAMPMSQPIEIVVAPTPGGAGKQAQVIGQGEEGQEPRAGLTGHGGGGGQGGGRATTAFFGVPTQGLVVVYLIDRSCSMGLNNALARARQELAVSLRHLPEKAHFQVLVYNQHVQPLVGRVDELLPARPETIAAVLAEMDRLEPSGGTRHEEPLKTALRLRPHVLYFLTDADDLTERDRLAVMQANFAHCPIHAIELTTLHRDQPDMPMQRLSRDTGGRYQAIDLGR